MNFKTGLIHSLLLLMRRPASPCWVPVASSFFLQFLGERRASLWPTSQQNSWTSLLSGPLGSRGWGMPGPFGVSLDQVAIPITNTGVQKVEWVTPIPGHWGGPLDFRCADLDSCSVSALIADSAFKLSLSCISSFAGVILVQTSTNLLPHTQTMMIVYLFVFLAAYPVPSLFTLQ